MAAYLSSTANLMDGALDGSLGYNLSLSSAGKANDRRTKMSLPATDQLTLALVMTVQKCLDPQALLNQLAEFVADFLPVRALAWENGSFMVSTAYFEQSDAHQTLSLTLPEQHLGKLTIDSQRPLRPEEIDWVSGLVDSVAYPLRNVCLYQKALASAERDPLTGLKNRRAFDAAIEQELARYTRYGTHSSLVMIDLTSFKAINDTWGHDVGDEVLDRMGQVLRQLRRETDQIYRFGGDEFAAILPGTTAYGAQHFAQRLTRWLAEHPLTIKSGEQFSIRAAVGYAQTQAKTDAKDWFRRADQALYAAKRNPVTDPMSMTL